jgi:hypothetical protein
VCVLGNQCGSADRSLAAEIEFAAFELSFPLDEDHDVIAFV